MGAWDIGPFDNDDAADWLYVLEESSDVSTIAAALGVITDIGDGYLEAPDCSNALAAVEIVAALRGHAQDTKRRYLIGRPCGQQLAARRGVSTIPGR
jgi:hypothetical protein